MAMKVSKAELKAQQSVATAPIVKIETSPQKGLVKINLPDSHIGTVELKTVQGSGMLHGKPRTLIATPENPNGYIWKASADIQRKGIDFKGFVVVETAIHAIKAYTHQLWLAQAGGNILTKPARWMNDLESFAGVVNSDIVENGPYSGTFTYGEFMDDNGKTIAVQRTKKLYLTADDFKRKEGWYNLLVTKHGVKVGLRAELPDEQDKDPEWIQEYYSALFGLFDGNTYQLHIQPVVRYTGEDRSEYDLKEGLSIKAEFVNKLRNEMTYADALVEIAEGKKKGKAFQNGKTGERMADNAGVGPKIVHGPKGVTTLVDRSTGEVLKPEQVKIGGFVPVVPFGGTIKEPVNIADLRGTFQMFNGNGFEIPIRLELDEHSIAEQAQIAGYVSGGWGCYLVQIATLAVEA